jgi:hypothetical protein
MRLSLAIVLAACGSSHAPPELDAWARTVLVLPLDQVCSTADDHPGSVYGTFIVSDDCLVRPSLVPPEIRALGATYIFHSRNRDGARYLVLDWGGGFIEANGIYVGNTGFVPDPDEGRPAERIRDGVYSFKTDEE